ncbi:hypothetical protein Tco_1466426 [Tanacetum coccineum]
MVAFLKKPNESVGFTKVVEFLKVRTLANRTQQLVASIDSTEYIITGASVRSKLQLADATGIHNLSDAEIYAGLPTLGINSLEKELKDTKQTLGNVVLKLVKKVKSLETALKRKSKKVIVSESEKSMKEKSTDFVTPTKASWEAQEEEISPKILEAAKTLSKVASQGVSKEKSTDKGKIYRRIASKRGQREGKALMVEEDILATHKTKEQMRQEEAGLEEAIKLQAQLDEEVAKQIHLDKMLEVNAELTKDMLGKDLPEQDFEKRMVDMVNQRKKLFAEERAKAKRNKPITQSQLRIYMSNYLKNQGTWKLSHYKGKIEKIWRRSLDKDFKETKSAQEDSETDKEESVEAMNPTPLTIKSNSVVNWKIFQQGQRSIYQIMRENRADTVYISFRAMVKDFTREDLIELYRLVMQKYGTYRPKDANDRVLWNDLRTMFDPPLNEDAIWSLPLQQKMVSWR